MIATGLIERGVLSVAQLETLVYVPPELGPTFEALRPAVERLARARLRLADFKPVGPGTVCP